LISNFGLLEEVGRALLNGLLLRSVIDDVVSDFLGLGMEAHNTLLEDVHLLLDVSLFLIHLA